MIDNQVSKATADEPLLEVQNLEVLYGGIAQALHGISLVVPKGKVVSLLGSNGAGKSTIMRSISGLLPYVVGSIKSGSIRYKGDIINRLPSDQRVSQGIVLVPEGREIIKSQTVRENLLLGAHSRRLSRSKLNQEIEEIYDAFPKLRELEHDKKRKKAAGYCSGGEQQMLAIGRALMAKPDLLLLDEPSLGLAPKIITEIYHQLAQWRGQLTILLVEQNARLSLEFSDYSYIIESGRIVTEGPSKDMREHPESWVGLKSAEESSYLDMKSYRPRKRWI